MTWHVGDRADADIATPVALDLVDAAATTALRSAQARQVPVVFRNYPGTTNLMVHEFRAVFTQTRTRFLTALAAGYNSQTETNPATAAADFARVLTAFNLKNPGLPVPGELAAEWARDGDGGGIQEKLLDPLRLAAEKPVRPDDPPEGLGETVRVVTVADPDQKLSPDAVQRGWLLPAASLPTISAAQKMLRGKFPAAEQPLARALAGFLEPNCFPDAAATQQARADAVAQLFVSEHFAAGEVIVHRGDIIDDRSLAALEVMTKKLAAAPAIVAAAGSAQPAAKTVAVSPPFSQPVVTPKSGGHLGWLIAVLAGISVSALLVAWQQARRQPGSPRQLSLASQAPMQLISNRAEDTTQMTQQLREAVMHELAMQRRELLLAQQTAAEEIAVLIRRLDELQLPMQERERTYEARIQALEEALARRTEENRELLTVKIEIVRKQLEAERAAHLGESRDSRN